uniref:Nucleotide exchange factor Fes1 domain-containing protein n=1 Tax=Spironucleus salmonicida TaxID=348837 RepID=V6LV29_9EUKA|eukprot:EST48108.1 Nucleotide exchange factor Fes1 domain-containing protein [Spironucleus salmonicida]
MNPQFMKTLYEWSTKQQSGISSMEPMDLQRQKWLQEAMESMFVDGATIIRTCFTALPDLNCEEQIDVWENLQELLENIDNAMVLKPLGKWPDIIKAMNKTTPSMFTHKKLLHRRYKIVLMLLKQLQIIIQQMLSKLKNPAQVQFLLQLKMHKEYNYLNRIFCRNFLDLDATNELCTQMNSWLRQQQTKNHHQKLRKLILIKSFNSDKLSSLYPGFKLLGDIV